MCNTTATCNANEASLPVTDHGEPAPAADAALLDDLVVANRILYDQGVVDAFGHVSVRHDKRADRFLLARNMAPALVTADDIVEFNLDGTPVTAKGRAVYLERFLHGEIYRARPDVMAIVHSHSPAVLPFTVVPGVSLRPVYHMSSFIGEGARVFEIREAAGPASDMLIRNAELGVALAKSLGSSSVILMRGHGSTVVGPTLQQTVYQAVYTEINARIQAEAMKLGPVIFLSAAEAEAASVNIGKQIQRPWELWKMRVS